MSFFQLGLRRAAAHLSRASIACGPCLRQQAFAPPPSRVLKLVKVPRRYATTKSESPLEFLSSNITKSAQAGSAKSSPKSSFFPETNDKVVGYWLLGSAVSVFGIVIFGGLTRLTESGYVDLMTGIHTKAN